MEPITTAVTTPIVLGGTAYPSPLDIDATSSVEPSGNVGANAISSSYAGVSLVFVSSAPAPWRNSTPDYEERCPEEP